MRVPCSGIIFGIMFGIMFGGGVKNALVTGNVVVAVGISFGGAALFAGMEGGSRPAIDPETFVSACRGTWLLVGGGGNWNSGLGGFGSAAGPATPIPGGGATIGFSLMS